MGLQHEERLLESSQFGRLEVLSLASGYHLVVYQYFNVFCHFCGWLF